MWKTHGAEYVSTSYRHEAYIWIFKNGSDILPRSQNINHKILGKMIIFALIYYPYLAVINSYMHIYFLNRVKWLVFNINFEFQNSFFWMEGVYLKRVSVWCSKRITWRIWSNSRNNFAMKHYRNKCREKARKRSIGCMQATSLEHLQRSQ